MERCKMGFKKTLDDNKTYGTMYLINALLHLKKKLGKSRTSNIIEKISNLSNENLEIFVDDIHTAMEERLKIFVTSVKDIEFKLSHTELKAFIALQKLRKDCTATEIAECLGIQRAPASKALNNLWRFNLIRKYRKNRKCFFTVVGSI